uniref:ABCA1-4-like C-terminal R2 regulatory domain-containing protein n=1 Tax=Timema genevievae TaxID=629358 RepID=A0A7R9PLV2_TIMGE|nr:unnamed protein product [Timema genevievae]
MPLFYPGTIGEEVAGTRGVLCVLPTPEVTSLTPSSLRVNHLSGSLLKEEHEGLMTYHVPRSTLTWSRMFGILEDAKRHLNIEDYSLGQTSLEQDLAIDNHKTCCGSGIVHCVTLAIDWNANDGEIGVRIPIYGKLKRSKYQVTSPTPPPFEANPRRLSDLTPQYLSNLTPQNPTTMTGPWTKFRLLMWKNWVLQKRHPVQTLVEILAPVVFSVMLVLVRSLSDPETYPDPTIYQPFSPGNTSGTVLELLANSSVGGLIAYSPSNSLTQSIMKKTAERLDMQLIAAPNESTLIQGLTQTVGAMKLVLAGIVFDDNLSNETIFPDIKVGT